MFHSTSCATCPAWTKRLSPVLNLIIMLCAVLSDSSSLTCNCLSTHQPATLFVCHLCNVIEYTPRRKYLNGKPVDCTRHCGGPARALFFFAYVSRRSNYAWKVRWANSAPLYQAVVSSGVKAPQYYYSVLKSLVRRINNSGDIAMYRFWRFGLKLPIHAPFGGVFLVIFPHITSDVIYRRDPQKDRAWAENVV